MSRILLVRHAAYDGLGGVLTGRTPGKRLNAEGQAQAERLAAALARVPLQAVYTSPLERAQETAVALAAPQGLEPIVRERLAELDFGAWTGRAHASLADDRAWRAFNAFRSGTPIPGGESMLGVQARAAAELIALRDAHPDGTIAVVSHADVIRALLGHFLGVPMDLLLRIEVAPASVAELTLGEDWCRLERLGWTPEGP